MTAKNAAALVRKYYPFAAWGVLVDRSTGERAFYIWDGVDPDRHLGVGEWGSTSQGPAWKAAAEWFITKGVRR